MCDQMLCIDMMLKRMATNLFSEKGIKFSLHGYLIIEQRDREEIFLQRTYGYRYE